MISFTLSFLAFLNPVTQTELPSWPGKSLSGNRGGAAGGGGKRTFVIFSNELSVIRANSFWDLFNCVTLKSGSTLAFPFSFLCSPASHNSLGPPHPFTSYTKTFRIWKFEQPPRGRAPQNLSHSFPTLQSFLAGAG